MKNNDFKLIFDIEGNSTRLFSNGIISVKVKLHKNDKGEQLNYNIIDINTGMILKNQACVSYRTMLKCIRRDIKQLFDIYKSSENYDLVITKKINVKNRRI